MEIVTRSLQLGLILGIIVTPISQCALSSHFKPLLSLCGLGIGGYWLYQRTRPVIPQHYTVNLMWINRELQRDQLYVTPSREHIDTLLQWSQKNPRATTVLWFDGSAATTQSIENTRMLVNRTTSKNSLKIVLRDIRELEYVKQHPEAFSTKIPVYSRGDLARIVAGIETVRAAQSAPYVYADFDVTPLSAAEIFDATTLQKLRKYHFVMAHEHNLLGFENSFQILTYDKNLLKAMELFILETNIRRAKEFVADKDDDLFFKGHPFAWKVHAAGFQENVYYSYPLMYAHFCQLNKWTQYNPMGEIDRSTENAKYLVLHSPALEMLKQLPMPTKKVVSPASTSLQREVALHRAPSS